jgi:hypothetical protein
MLNSELYTEVLDQIANNVLGDIMGAFNLTKNEPYAPTTWAGDGAASTTDNNAWQVTALVWLNGAEPRRQARTYLPVMPIGAMNDLGSFDPALLDDILAFAAALLLPISDTNIAVQRVISNRAGTDFIVPTNLGFNDSPRTQRRRTKGRGS